MYLCTVTPGSATPPLLQFFPNFYTFYSFLSPPRPPQIVDLHITNHPPFILLPPMLSCRAIYAPKKSRYLITLRDKGCFKARWKTWYRPSLVAVSIATLLPFGDTLKRVPLIRKVLKVIRVDGLRQGTVPRAAQRLRPPPTTSAPSCSVNLRAPMEESLTQPSNSRVQRSCSLMAGQHRETAEPDFPPSA